MSLHETIQLTIRNADMTTVEGCKDLQARLVELVHSQSSNELIGQSHELVHLTGIESLNLDSKLMRETFIRKMRTVRQRLKMSG